MGEPRAIYLPKVSEKERKRGIKEIKERKKEKDIRLG